MEKSKRTAALLERWYAGQTTGEEEAQLRDALFGSGAALPEADALLLTGLQALAEERCPAPQPPMSRALQTAGRPRRMRLLWGAATGLAAAAAVAVGIFLGVQQPREPYCYIDGVAVYDKTQALAATECLQGLGALDTAEQLFDQLLMNFNTNNN